MIISRAVTEFLSRKLESFDWIKTATESELDWALAQLSPKAKFYTKPWAHQKAGFLIGASLPRFLFLYDMGIGKTKIVLDVLDYRARRKEWKRALVLVPNNANIYSWQDDAKLHRPDIPLQILTGTRAEKSWAWDRTFVTNASTPTICVASYPGFLAMVCRKRD